MKIYLASSWRNEFYPDVLAMLREWDYDVYDFRRPVPGCLPFTWEEIDPNYRKWTSRQFADALNTSDAATQFCNDFRAMQQADVFVGVAPFGRSASMEMGWAAGSGKPAILYFPTENNEMGPELMAKMFDIALSFSDLRHKLELLRGQLCGHTNKINREEVVQYLLECFRKYGSSFRLPVSQKPLVIFRKQNTPPDKESFPFIEIKMRTFNVGNETP